MSNVPADADESGDPAVLIPQRHLRRHNLAHVPMRIHTRFFTVDFCLSRTNHSLFVFVEGGRNLTGIEVKVVLS